MIKINIICVGNLKEKYLSDAQDEYVKRLSKFAKITIKQLPEKNGESNSNLTIQKESELILENIKNFAILLDIKGQLMSSENLSNYLDKLEQNESEIDFVIGGSNGVNEKVKEKANVKLSFSPMTFPHQLARIMLLEQIYRAKTISNNMPYHK